MQYSWFILLLVVAGTAFFLLLLQGTSIGKILHEGIPDKPRRRLFVASVSFFLTFAAVRAVVYGVLHHIPPFHFIIQPSGRHIHHLVIGIVILLLVGYGWLADIGTGEDDSSILLSRLMSILYGVGAALTLDEFALWLDLRGARHCFSHAARRTPSENPLTIFGSVLAPIASASAIEAANKMAD
jgi:hypothetical protein